MAITFEDDRHQYNIYLNGTEVGNLPDSFTDRPQDYIKIVLGNDLVPPSCAIGDPKFTYIGEIGQFFMWKKALRSEDIRFIYNNLYREIDCFIRWADFVETNNTTIGCNDAITKCK